MLRRIVLIALSALLINVPAFAGNEDDASWISECIDDNKKEGQPVETVIVYCHCMNSKMSASESKSISEWEKSHPAEAMACSKKAGWE